MTADHEEKQYLRLLRQIIETGEKRGNRTNTGTIATFGEKMVFNLRESIPFLTTKRLAWKTMLRELLWFISGKTDNRLLQSQGVHIWDGNTSREYLDGMGLTEREEGDLGPCFPAGTPVLTERGYYAIETVDEKDRLYTHLGNWQSQRLVRHSTTGWLYQLKAYGMFPLDATMPHPIYICREKGENPVWVKMADVKVGDYVGMKVDSDKGYIPLETEMEIGKEIPPWILTTANEFAKKFLNKYLERHGYQSLSLETALMIQRLFFKLRKFASIYCGPNGENEGKIYTIVNVGDFDREYNDEYFFNQWSEYIWVKVSGIERRWVEELPVYNFIVAEDNTYVVGNITVHNCYGFQWRHFGAEYKDCHTDYSGKGVDQLREVVRLLREEPTSRRIILSAWNPAQQHLMVLPPCFPAGTLVLTHRGYLPIEEVQITDQLLSHRGIWRKINRRHMTSYTGKMIHIRTAHSTRTICATEGHPFLVYGGKEKEKWTNAGNLRVGDYLGFPIDQESQEYLDQFGFNKLDDGIIPEWFFKYPIKSYDVALNIQRLLAVKLDMIVEIHISRNNYYLKKIGRVEYEQDDNDTHPVFEKSYYWTPIQEIEIVSVCDKIVYNFDVEEEHTYIVENIAVHNCHMFAQWYVREGRYLDCQLYQRSADMALGVPFNIASYATLTYILAHLTGLVPNRLIHIMGDTHLYLNHLSAVEEQLTREPYPFPKLRFRRQISEIDDFREEDFILEDYKYHSTIQMEMVV